MNTEIKSIVVSGKRWFDRKNGNTYFSNRVYIDGEYLDGINYEYGYDDMYIQRARDLLIRAGIFKDDTEFYTPLYKLCNEQNIKLVTLCSDVATKKDLK